MAKQTKESIKNLIRSVNDHGYAEYDCGVKIVEELVDGFKVCVRDDDNDEGSFFTIVPSDQYDGLVMIESDMMMGNEPYHLVEHVSAIPRTVFAVMYA